jgi:Zn-dependent peptidase ImmA (M78 family)
MDFQPIYKNTDQINSDAESFLDNYHHSMSIPVPIEEIIDLQLQIDIVPIPGLKDTFEKAGLDIDAFISSDFKSITVDKYVQEKVNTRYRFTLAHEIGHRFLHGYLYTQFKFNTIDGWIDTINNMPLYEIEVVEGQANEFAGLVLVPRRILKDEFKKALKESEELCQVSYAEKPEIVRGLAILILAGKFKVSEDVIRIRLERDGLKKR